MKRHEFEHIFRAAAEISGESSFIVIGSQAIWADREHVPTELSLSKEVD